MKTLMKLLLSTLAVIVLASCSVSGHTHTPLNTSASYYNFLQPSFDAYLTSTERWLREHRQYISADHEKELAMNMPFSLGSKAESDKAILLVHGLGDSPYSFSDLATSLENQGFYVQTVLLPGHGSNPKDLMLPHYSDWQAIVDHYANLLKKDFDDVWLGGFSTGANLATIHALENDDISGLMLFSPGFQSRTPKLERLAPIAALFFDGYEAEERNFARYTSAPLNGAIAYSESAVRLRELLSDKVLSIPTLIAISEADSVVDPYAVKDLYLNHFSHPQSKLVWYGDAVFDHGSIETLNMKLPALKVSTGSHMSPLFTPQNPYYGIGGERKMCMNSFDDDAVKQCENGAEVWYAAWGYEEDHKIHARLTWNPYYEKLEAQMTAVAM